MLGPNPSHCRINAWPPRNCRRELAIVTRQDERFVDGVTFGTIAAISCNKAPFGLMDLPTLVKIFPVPTSDPKEVGR
jgi:hypothetical protein